VKRKGGWSGEEERRIVYSTERGLVCPVCRGAAGKCSCAKEIPPKGGDGIVRVRRETKGRGGKTVTVASGIPLGASELAALAGEIKRKCGSGGTAKDGTIEIQGDHRDAVSAALREKGYTVKLAGG
jgi:translation initiation factor 1